MGIEWTLVNTHNKTMFDMGKGWAYEIIPNRDEAPLFLYRETFVQHIIDIDKDDWGYQDTPEHREYITTLANTLFDFVDGADPETELKVFSDCGDDVFDYERLGYIYLGSRYTGMKDYNGYIHELNSHIKSPDLSPIDFNWPILRIRKLLTFA